MEDSEKYKDIDALLNRIASEVSKAGYYQLQELFDQKLAYLDITKHQASKILDIDPKTLDAILTGDNKKVDFVTILKLSEFLEITPDEIVNKYFQLVNTTHKESITLAKKRSYLVNHFNLPSLKKIGFIDSINDFEEIEKRINTFFGYEDIFEHSKHKIKAAFSSAKRLTNKENLEFWYAAARQSLEKTPNPNEYDREKLKAYFPQIRWHSMNVERGLILVAQELFKLGVTLIIVPKFAPDIHVRGATFSYRDKPCIALTKYTKFYGTMWFALIHELYHVLYDWDEIKKEEYHFSGEAESIRINENEANKFARQYLFSDEKMNVVKNRIHDPNYVKDFAEKNHVHPSIIYTFYSWDSGDDRVYAKFDKFIPDFSKALEPFKTEDFTKFTPIKEISKDRNNKLSYTI